MLTCRNRKLTLKKKKKKHPHILKWMHQAELGSYKKFHMEIGHSEQDEKGGGEKRPQEITALELHS